jgi:MFS family permease
MDYEKRINESTVPASHEYGVDQERDVALVHTVPLAQVPKGRWERSWPVIACGAGLFSDGYLNGVIGSVTTMLRLIYGDEYTNSSYKSAVPSIAFAGTVVGHLFFGVLSDHWSRRNTLLISTISERRDVPFSGGAKLADKMNSLDRILDSLRWSIRGGRKCSRPLRCSLCISLSDRSRYRRRIVGLSSFLMGISLTRASQSCRFGRRRRIHRRAEERPS